MEYAKKGSYVYIAMLIEFEKVEDDSDADFDFGEDPCRARKTQILGVSNNLDDGKALCTKHVEWLTNFEIARDPENGNPVWTEDSDFSACETTSNSPLKGAICVGRLIVE